MSVPLALKVGEFVDAPHAYSSLRDCAHGAKHIWKILRVNQNSVTTERGNVWCAGTLCSIKCAVCGRESAGANLALLAFAKHSLISIAVSKFSKRAPKV